MAKGLNIPTAMMALLGIAPWAVYLGGLAKLTDVLTDFDFRQVTKQYVIMLEWYIVSSQLINLIIIVILGFANGLHRAHSFLNMFLAVASTLMILQATLRVQEINAVRDGIVLPGDAVVTRLLGMKDSPLPYLRAMATGQIATATWNFFLAILISFAGTEAAVRSKSPDAQGQKAMMA
ncbi:hypothetical protein VOLCADRAFT_102698 [Volvox carteri f. nagariensis]|uniref:Uncharacterized protein n=1 Tax=Volvox carteri f. nagariensis TaxID=3068 RepID=D8THH9_VOLCA|nr:uncharacterized protein VOLCADRAFT_102698 [Volvox carteri f. nagariensis]EFJ52713.1 hypothetical protein VOLCADRAFT_102698 [Volvox carteri f. nagariensis]|eukprot:XP_002945718.1 hypothetical protein VOLCADRAFT_102698 [Volvox carteri f. nagariensis]